MFTISILCMFILLIYYLYNKYYTNYKRNWRLIKLIPGPPGFPITDNLFQWHISEEEKWKLHCTLSNEYYTSLKVWSFSIFVVFIRHPDDLEAILSSTNHIEKGIVYEALHPWLGTGLLTSKGVKWHTRRKILTPTFHFNILNQFVDILTKEGDCMTKSLTDVGGTVVKDLLPFISEHS